MVNYVGHEKPKLEDLEHYGVLGMKWGKTRARANGTEIRRARRSVAGQINKIADQRDKVKTEAKGSEQRAKQQQKLKKMQVDFLKSPDRVTAHRLTRGEKAAAVILLTPAGAAAAIGVSSAISRRIERKQELKKYNK